MKKKTPPKHPVNVLLLTNKKSSLSKLLSADWVPSFPEQKKNWSARRSCVLRSFQRPTSHSDAGIKVTSKQAEGGASQRASINEVFDVHVMTLHFMS